MAGSTASAEPWLRRRVAELEAENRRLEEALRLKEQARANATRDAAAAHATRETLESDLAWAQLDVDEFAEYARELQEVSASIAEAVCAPPPPLGGAPVPLRDQ